MSELKRRIKSVPLIDNSNDKVKENHKTPVQKYNQISLRLLSRVVVVISFIVIIYFTANNEKIKIFAKQSDQISGKSQYLKCSPQYLNEIDKFNGCVPHKCKRFVADTVVSLKDVEGLLSIAKKGFQYGRSLGGASILDLHSGAMSKGQVFINIYESPYMKQLFTEEDFNLYRSVKEKVKHTIATHFGIEADKLHLTSPTFISEMTSKEPVTLHDEYWHPHIDKETYTSFHYTSLVYLSNYNIDFTGGRFTFIDESFNTTIEPKKGRLSIFTSGHENLHFVEKVQSGTRYAMTIAFTCDSKYAIHDPSVKKYNIPSKTVK
ncbi:unnamed protein product [Leptidea sinapis]|uniref:Fe2OG dioxygenase domain-containing protein n=1 Tax=Leptidea sinapis TaxID=189913 RepID=A0A5E4QCS7_9NEOP|nr:unnamed protein product [Leptidea sinapis]